jgi:diguanylate cyclase (GGDEF)-like protein/PAS domain S-box-containing protein
MAKPNEFDIDAQSRDLVERAPDIVVLLDNGTIRYVNPAAAIRTGWTPEQVVGRSIIELIHPDDVERAAFDLDMYTRDGTVLGSSSYRVGTSDGRWLLFDVAASEITVGEKQMMVLYCRPDDSASTSVLYGLLAGTSTAEMLRPVCDVFNWHLHGSRVGIAWRENNQWQSVSTDLPASLSGGDDEPDTPWAASRATANMQRAATLAALDAGRRQLAEELGLGEYWIEPVVDEHGEACALVTLWMREGGRTADMHTLGMNMAKDYAELIVRWTRQQRQLDDAAHTDVLTELANRKAFFDALEDCAGGAVLYCDLDRFKPVNDVLGHHAGDELLRAVAGRMQACVRSGDLVARLGGDEFAVLCSDVTPEQAFELAQRIRAAIVEPFHIADTTTCIGISIGVAHSAHPVGEEVLELADRALYRAKIKRDSSICWPTDP